MEHPEVMSVKQAALYLGVSTDALYLYVSEGTVPGFKLGNRWKFKKSILDKWMIERMDQFMTTRRQLSNGRRRGSAS